jgi:hypothetical protein
MLRFCRRARIDGGARVQISDLAELNVAWAKLGAIETHKKHDHPQGAPLRLTRRAHRPEDSAKVAGQRTIRAAILKEAG